MIQIRSLRRRALALALLVATASPVLAQSVGAPNSGDADQLAYQVKLLADDPRNLEALLTAGELSSRLGDTAAALAFFSRAEAVDPNSARIYAGRGSVLVQMEKPGEALRMFNEAELRGMPPTQFAASRGFAYDLLGAPELAQRDYRLALQHGNNDDTVRKLALSLGITGRGDEAMTLLDPLLRRSDRASWRARAFILAMGGDVAGAEKIATSMMPANMGAALTPFFRRLPTLGAADRAFAVHFGELAPTPARLADARSAPPLPAYTPDRAVLAAAAPATATKVAAAPVSTGKDRRSRRERERDEAAQRAADAAKAQQAAQLAAAKAAVPPLEPPRYSAPMVQPLPGYRSSPTPAPVQLASQPPVSQYRPTPAPSAPQPSVSQYRPTPTPSQPMVSQYRPAPIPTPTPTPSQPVVSQYRPGPASALTPSPTPAPTPIPSQPVVSQYRPATSQPAQILPQATQSTPASQPSPQPTQFASAGQTRPVLPAESDTRVRADGVVAAPSGPAPTPIPVTPVSQPAASPITPPSDSPAPRVADTGGPVPQVAESPPPQVREPEPVRTAAPKAGAPARGRGRSALASIVEGIDIPDSERAIDAVPTTTRSAKGKQAAGAAEKDLKDAKGAKGKAKPAKPDPAKLEPERIWVQVAGGANEGALPGAWKKLTAQAPAAFKGKTPWTAPLHATNRLLAGPFKSDDDAQEFVNSLRKQGISAFQFTSDAGEKINKLGVKGGSDAREERDDSADDAPPKKKGATSASKKTGKSSSKSDDDDDKPAAKHTSKEKPAAKKRGHK